MGSRAAAHLLQEIVRTLAHIRARLPAREFHRQHHILQRRQIGHQVERLEHKAHLLNAV